MIRMTLGLPGLFELVVSSMMLLVLLFTLMMANLWFTQRSYTVLIILVVILSKVTVSVKSEIKGGEYEVLRMMMYRSSAWLMLI